MSALLDAFNAREGIVCAVGAGGKKSTLYRLAREHPGRVGVTATSYTTYFPAELNALEIVSELPELEQRVLASEGPGCVAYARTGDKPARLRGLPISLVRKLHETGGFVYVEIRKAICGLLQEGILANKQLRERLAPFGYYEIAYTPGLW